MPMVKSQITSRRAQLLAVAATALFVVAPAQAQGEPPKPGASAVNQYVETVPATSSVGQYVEAVPTGTGSSAPGVSAESPSARGDEEQAISRTLEGIAKSSRYGAPTPRRTGTKDAAASGMPDAPATTSVSASLRSTLGALGTASDARLFGLLAVVLVTTLGVITLATRRGPP